MPKKQAHLNIPVSHFSSVLSWSKRTIGRLVGAAVESAVQAGLSSAPCARPGGVKA